MDTRKIAEHLNATMKNISTTKPISTDVFIAKCKNYVREYYDDDKMVVCQVWYCKTIQNHKALMIGATPDNVYFEFTYNGDKNEIYMDVYKKSEKRVYNC